MRAGLPPSTLNSNNIATVPVQPGSDIGFTQQTWLPSSTAASDIHSASHYAAPRPTEAPAQFAPNGSTSVKPDADLMWLEGKDVRLNHVYFGEDSTNLSLVSSQVNNIFTPPENLIPGRTYYWRVDTEQKDKSIIDGDLWSFQVADNPRSTKIVFG